MGIFDTFLVDLILFYFLTSWLILCIFTLETLVDSPDFVDVIIDPLETFVILEERVEFVGIVDMRISLPLDVEPLLSQPYPR